MMASARRKWIGLALLCAVQFMVVLDIAIVNVALPSIQTDLGFSQENLQWVISAYALLFGGFLLLGGRAADLLGRRRLFLAGIVVFTGASLISGLAWNEEALIGARALQGLGAAIISPAALSILMTTFAEGKDRNAALGAWGAVGAFGAVAGVLLGGIFTDLLSWEWIFFVNVPVGIAAFALTPLLIAESRDETAESFDIPGAVLVTSGLVALVYAITQANDYGWASLETIGLFAASAVLMAAFLAWESAREGSAHAVLDLPSADARRRQRRRADPGHGDVRDVPDAHAVHAAGARLLADAHRRRLPGCSRDGDLLVSAGRPARHADRGQAGARGRDGGV